MSRRFIVGITAACLLFAVIWGVLEVTTKAAPVPPCPRCHSANVIVGVKYPTTTVMICKDCSKYWHTPPRGDFSWAQAVEFWLSDE